MLICVATQLISSSYDCTMRQTSFASGLSREIVNLEDALISSFDLPPKGNEVWISDTDGWISHIDLREDMKHGRRWNLTQRSEKIGCISINPVTPHFLVTACNDRSLKYVPSGSLDRYLR